LYLIKGNREEKPIASLRQRTSCEEKGLTRHNQLKREREGGGKTQRDEGMKGCAMLNGEFFTSPSERKGGGDLGKRGKAANGKGRYDLTGTKKNAETGFCLPTSTSRISREGRETLIV